MRRFLLAAAVATTACGRDRVESVPRLVCDGGPCGDPGTSSGDSPGDSDLECVAPADCTDPPGDHLACFAVDCLSHQCVYTPQPGTVCEAETCTGGYIYPERTCNDSGACPFTVPIYCHGFACDPVTTTPTCSTTCTVDAGCLPGMECQQGTVCFGPAPDGAPCTSPGDCQSSYCDGMRCCQAGDCCNVPIDCPATYDSPPVCIDTAETTDCQGERQARACQGHVCASELRPDDRGCAGVAHTCPGNLDPVLCLDAEHQDPPVCPSSCTVNTDCLSSFRCDQNGVCVDLLPNGLACIEDSDCVYGNCAEDFDTATTVCAPRDHCVDDDTYLTVGDVRCRDDAWARECTSEGVWGTDQPNPDPDGSLCDAGGGDASGHDLPATCTDGTGWNDLGCMSCEPYYALSVTACDSSCATDDDGRCWDGYHCYSDDDQCYSGANGQACDADGDCTSGRCTGNQCAPKLANGSACIDDGDCTSGNCSEDFDSSTLYCAAAGRCANNSTSYVTGYELCSGNDYWRRCIAEGDWGSQSSNPDPVSNTCDAGGGAGSGYDPAATCNSGASGGWTNPGCTSCEPIMAFDNGSGCRSGCANLDSNCWSAYHCYNPTDVCESDVNGACDSDSECSSDNCECANSSCTTRVCAPSNCVCGWSSTGGCNNDLADGTNDPEDCAGSNGCYGGECRSDAPGSCTCTCLGGPPSQCTNPDCCGNLRVVNDSCGSGWSPSCTAGQCGWIGGDPGGNCDEVEAGACECQ